MAYSIVKFRHCTTGMDYVYKKFDTKYNLYAKRATDTFITENNNTRELLIYDYKNNALAWNFFNQIKTHWPNIGIVKQHVEIFAVWRHRALYEIGGAIKVTNDSFEGVKHHAIFLRTINVT